MQSSRASRCLGLRASLFTDGIKANRDLLAALCETGLTDVAFHVNSTQERAGYATEQHLNALRLVYVERARGLPLSVFFTTTVHAGIFAGLPMLAAFIVQQAPAVRFASFQLQTETGRGVLSARDDRIDDDCVGQRLRQGAGAPELKFNVLAAETPPDSLPQGPQRTAYEINAYNALSMFNVVAYGIPATHAGLNKLRVFVLRRGEVGCQPMSLRAFENVATRTAWLSELLDFSPEDFVPSAAPTLLADANR
ncbi:MAG: DUF547 domain-containing protein [Pseudomonadota bacterium]|nr:DUF547 domain-containing protein [Pseudomonadota bacterium]